MSVCASDCVRVCRTAACSSQEQLLAARREQDRLSRQLAGVRGRLAERDSKLADSTRQLSERSSQLADAVRSVELKTAQVVGLKSAVRDAAPPAANTSTAGRPDILLCRRRRGARCWEWGRKLPLL